MGEIKSSLELAMERTKKFAISEEEREAFKQKEIVEKGSRLFHRYREGHLPLNEILKEIEKMEKKTSSAVKEYLLSQWIDALALDDDAERILKGIEVLKPQITEEIKKEFYYLLSHYQEEKKKLKEKARHQTIEGLKKEGIYGSAVEPHIEGSQIWKNETEKLSQSYQRKLEDIKKQLRR